MDQPNTEQATLLERLGRACFRRRRLVVLVWLAVLIGLAVAGAARSRAADPPGEVTSEAPRFDRDVLPTLVAHCFKCHGSEAAKAGLDLRG